MIGLLIVIMTRLLAALLMFFFPLSGYIMTVLGDLSDLWILLLFQSNADYVLTDKVLDLITLSTAWLVSLRFNKTCKRVSTALFFWRAMGMIIFFIFPNEILFVLFPNIFEMFFMLCLIQRKFFPQNRITKKNVMYVLMIAAIPKLVHEWLLHATDFDMAVYNWAVDIVDMFRL